MKKKLQYLALITLGMIAIRTSLAQTPMFYVGPGGTFFIGSGFLYQNGNISFIGEGRNEDSILFTGNFSAAGKFTSTGTEVFLGTGNQEVLTVVKGVNGFGHIVKQNDGNIILDYTVYCDSVSLLTNGKIISRDTLKIKGDAITSIKGYSNLRYIDVDDNIGVLSRKTSILGTDYVWPMGNSIAGYKRFDITLSSLGSGGTSFVNGKLKNSSPGFIAYSKFYSTGFSGNYPGMPCSAGTNAQWVEFTCLAPNYYNFSGPSDFVSVVTAWSESCDPASAGPQRVLRSPVGSGFWTNYIDSIVGTLTTELCENSYWLGGVALSINGGHYKGFGDFAIAGGYGTPLPLELVAFTGYNDNTRNVLSWQTASEFNVDRFEIYRSTEDFFNKVLIGSQKAVGGNTTTDYTIYDENPMIGNNYYILKMSDNDGAFKYSNIINIPITADNINSITGIYPNPANETVTITIQSTHDFVSHLTIHDVLGHIMIERSTALQKGVSESSIDISSFSKGTYIISFSDVLGVTHQKKFIKQ